MQQNTLANASLHELKEHLDKRNSVRFSTEYNVSHINLSGEVGWLNTLSICVSPFP